MPYFRALAVSAYTPAPLAVTIYDIAERAGVSIATVSRVLNDNPRVSDGTRANVLSVADALGYRPHASAQSLARRRSHLVSAVVPVLTNHFFLEVLRGLQDRLAESAYDLVIYASRTQQQVDAQLELALQRGRAAGTMLFSTTLPPSRAERLRQAGQPVVLVDAFHADFDSVSIDNEQGGYLATRALLEAGHRRIGLLMGHPDAPPAAARHAGYLRALAEAGLGEGWVVQSDDETAHGFSEAEGRAGMQALLAREPNLDAVFATSDVQALGALEVLREAGLSVPGCVSLVGFDDIDPARWVGLTTLRQPMYEMGKLAAEKLLRRLEEPERPTSHTVFAPQLVRRTTCGSPGEASVVSRRVPRADLAST